VIVLHGALFSDSLYRFEPLVLADQIGKFDEFHLGDEIAIGAGVPTLVAIFVELLGPGDFFASPFPAVFAKPIRVLGVRLGVFAFRRLEFNARLLPAIASREMDTAAIADIDIAAGKRLLKFAYSILGK
jgi:hypothetical protein